MLGLEGFKKKKKKSLQKTLSTEIALQQHSHKIDL